MSQTLTENTMSSDNAIARIAATAFSPEIFAVYTNTRGAQQLAVKGQYPHLVVVGKMSQRVEMVGLVETAASLQRMQAAAKRWRSLEPLQAAAYLYVPLGYCAEARTLCLRERLQISDFRHYWLDDEGFHVAKCFA